MTAPAMRDRLDARLSELKDEFARGKARLEQIEGEADKLRETLLRVAGAIQVLTEELGRDGDAAAPEGVGPP